jgi:hypothetical protein
MSRWDIPLRRFNPPHDAQQANDAVYGGSPAAPRTGSALGGAGPTDATWKAFNGNLPRSEIQIGPGFQAADVITRPGQRLAVADLTPLHPAHHREDMDRPAGQLPPFGRPDTRSMGYSGYHIDIYCKEIYHLDIGFTWAHHRV